MKLEEFIQDYNEAYVKIGAHHGSGFIFCGLGKDFLGYEENYSIERREWLQKQIINNANQIRFYDAKQDALFLRNCNRFINDLRKSKQDEKYKRAKEFKDFATLDDYMESLKRERYKLLERYYKREKTLTKMLDRYTPIRDREVKEVYKSVLPNKYGVKDTIILYKGTESGKYWDITEFEEGVSDEE